MRVLHYLTEFQKQLAFRPDQKTRPQPLSVACKLSLEEYFVNLRLFMPHLERKAHFENIYFKLISHAGNLRTYVGNLGTIIGAKLCHASIQG